MPSGIVILTLTLTCCNNIKHVQKDCYYENRVFNVYLTYKGKGKIDTLMEAEAFIISDLLNKTENEKIDFFKKLNGSTIDTSSNVFYQFHKEYQIKFEKDVYELFDKEGVKGLLKKYRKKKKIIPGNSCAKKIKLNVTSGYCMKLLIMNGVCLKSMHADDLYFYIDKSEYDRIMGN